MNLVVAQLLALLLGATFNGIFFTLFVILILLLLDPTFPNRFHRNILIPVACIMMVLSTTHLVLSFVRAIEAFASGGEPPKDYYSDFRNPLQTAKTCVFIAQTLLGDGVMIWRCYIVYNNSRCILLLSILPLGFNLVFGVIGARAYGRESAPKNVFEGQQVWISAYMVVTLAVNLLCSAAVVYKIYRSTSELQAFQKVFPLVGSIIKSGALYVTSILALLITYFAHSNGLYSALDIVVPLVGIVFSLIILQIHFHLKGGLRPNPLERTSTLPTLGTLPHWRHQFTGGAELGMQDTIDSQLQNSSPTSPSGDIDTDPVSLKFNPDKQTKGGRRRL